MFTPNPDRTFTKKVTFNVPSESGAFQQFTLPVKFKALPKDQLRTLQEEADDETAFERVVIGVEDVGDADGNKLEPAAAKAAMAQEPSFVYEATLTYYDAMLGGNLKAKTSARRRGTG